MNGTTALKPTKPAVIDLQQVGPGVLPMRHSAGHVNIIIEQFDSGEHWVAGNDALSGFVFHLVDRTILSLNDSLSRLPLQNLGFNQLLVRKADMIQAGSFLLAVLHQPHHLL